MEQKFPWKAVTAGVAGAASLVALDLALRPLFMKWGATDEETDKVWPGDELSPDPVSIATRAVTAPGRSSSRRSTRRSRGWWCAHAAARPREQVESCSSTRSTS